MNAEKGFVYILTNPSFREDWVKIGKSSRPVDIRSKELDNTAVPLPFEIFATLKTSKYERVENLLHKAIDRLTNLRIRQNREFFNVAPSKALDLLKDIAETIDDAEITEYATGNPKSAPRNADADKASAETVSAGMVSMGTDISAKWIPRDREPDSRGRLRRRTRRWMCWSGMSRRRSLCLRPLRASF